MVAEIMPAELPYIEVAVSLPVFNTFTYEVPESLRASAVEGKRVLVPFKNRQVTGYIIERLPATDQAGMKKVIDVLDDIPMFPSSMIPFFGWISNYYQCPMGEVIKGALPGGLNITQVETVCITDKGRSMLSGRSLKRRDRLVLEKLDKQGPSRLRSLDEACGIERLSTALYTLEREGWIIRERKLKPGRVRPKMERYVEAVEERPSAESLSEVRRRIIEIVDDQGKISMAALKALVPSAGRLVKKMAEDGFLSVVERCVYRDPFGEPITPEPGGPSLTRDQTAVVETLLNTLGKGFQTYLLD